MVKSPYFHHVTEMRNLWICCWQHIAHFSNKLPATSYQCRHRVTAAVGGKEQRVMCVRACAISIRLPSPRTVIGYIYINSKITAILAFPGEYMFLTCGPPRCCLMSLLQRIHADTRINFILPET